jgi:hypothetical protein
MVNLKLDFKSISYNYLHKFKFFNFQKILNSSLNILIYFLIDLILNLVNLILKSS